MRIGVLDNLTYDYYDYGSARYLITNTPDEFSIQRIHPYAYVTVEIDDEDFRCSSYLQSRNYGR